MSATLITRRRLLLAGTAAALVVGTLGYRRFRAPRTVEPARPLGGTAWIAIETDGRVALSVNVTELGQGVWTALAQGVAEELDVALERISVRMAPVTPEFYGPVRYRTANSASMARVLPELRALAAAAREMLVAAAAARWNVAAAECTTSAGVVEHAARGLRAPYAELASAAGALPVPANPVTRNPAAWRVLGRPTPRLEAGELVDGTAIYGTDFRVPDMRHAALERRPTPGSTLAGVDRAAALAVPRATHLLQFDDAVVAVAADRWSAERALAAARVQWEIPANERVSSATLEAELRAGVRSAIAAVPGDVRAEYAVPLLAHAPIEPMVATARAQDGAIEVWASTQAQSAIRDAVAEALALPRERVHVHTPRVGGGFGRRLLVDYAVDAARAARETGAPVQVSWSRAADFAGGYFRPAVAAAFAATHVDGRLRSIAGRLRGLTPGDRRGGLTDAPYRFPAASFEYSAPPTAVRTGPWRSVDLSANTFFLEAFLNRCARAVQRDPLAYRRELLAHDARALRVLDALEQAVGWQDAASRGQALGVALVAAYGSYCAQAVEVERHAGAPRVRAVHAVVDCGLVANPLHVHAQIEGAIAMGLSAVLAERITLTEGRVDQRNYDSYRLLGMSAMPPVHVEVLPSTVDSFGGVGELAVPPVAPALCGALQALDGVWRDTLPVAGDIDRGVGREGA